MVEVEKGGLSTPATPLEMLRLYSSLYKLYYRHPSACEIKQQTVFTPYDECEYFMDGCDIMLDEGGNLAASKIRNLECPSYEICLIDYGCGKFNRKIHIMEQYP